MAAYFKAMREYLKTNSLGLPFDKHSNPYDDSKGLPWGKKQKNLWLLEKNFETVVQNMSDEDKQQMVEENLKFYQNEVNVLEIKIREEVKENSQETSVSDVSSSDSLESSSETKR